MIIGGKRLKAANLQSIENKKITIAELEKKLASQPTSGGTMARSQNKGIRNKLERERRSLLKLQRESQGGF